MTPLPPNSKDHESNESRVLLIHEMLLGQMRWITAVQRMRNNVKGTFMPDLETFVR